MSEKISDIPIIILCGGQGTRLREETEYKPKPMVEIGGKPILWHIMKSYSYFGFRNFILALGYKGHMIKEYFLNYSYYNNNFTIDIGNFHIERHKNNTEDEKHWKVTLVDTGEHAMTGARVKRCLNFVNSDNFGVTYGDGVCDVDLSAEFEFHLNHNKLGTMLGVNPVSKFGEIVIEGDKIVQFREKPQVGSGLVNGGFLFFKREFSEYLIDRDSCYLEREPLEKVSANGELFVYKHDGFWQCMDNYRDYLFLNDIWKSKNHPWARWMKD